MVDNPAAAVGTGSAREAPARLHYLDAARAFMLLLGLPFHASEVYRVSGGFDIASPDTSFVASALTALVHIFRMPAFFMLAGFFSAMLLVRRPSGQWLRGRLIRLGVPLVATTLLLGPWEVAVVISAHSGGGIVDTLPFALEAPLLAWVSHRWFLIVLLLFSALVALVHPRLPDRAVARLGESGGRWVWPVFLLVLAGASVGAVLAGKLLGDVVFHSGAVKSIASSFARDLPFFIVGYWAFRSGRQELMSGPLRGWERAAAGLFIALYLGSYFAFYPPDFADRHPAVTLGLRIVRHVSEGVAGYYASRLFFAGFARIFRRQHAVVGYFVDASLTIYLVHMIFLHLLAARMLQVGWPPLVEIVVSTSVALAGSIAVFECVRRSRWLSFLFSGAAPRRPGTPAAWGAGSARAVEVGA